MPNAFTACAQLPDDNQAPPLAVAISPEGVLCALPSYDFLWQGRLFEQLRRRARQTHLIGTYEGRPCYALAVADDPIEGFTWCRLRTLLENVEKEHFVIASRAAQILNWFESHRYCGNCGLPTDVIETEHATFCDRCQLQYYPRISPCVIVLVTRGDECLLARNTAWKEDWYSALAGFVEAAESAEQTIHREVAEEVGLQVTNLRYFASESWPFPGQLMLGFYADYLAGEIEVDGEEIAEAQWWRYDRLPQHPGTISLSGRLIKNFVDSWK